MKDMTGYRAQYKSGHMTLRGNVFDNKGQVTGPFHVTFTRPRAERYARTLATHAARCSSSAMKYHWLQVARLVALMAPNSAARHRGVKAVERMWAQVL